MKQTILICAFLMLLFTAAYADPQTHTFPALDTNNTFTGDMLFKSGRPWYDVMGFGAKNDKSTDDTAAIQAAITAACATPTTGGTIYFPPGRGYLSSNTNVIPFNIPCDGITFEGTAWTQVDSPSASQPPSEIFCPNCNVYMFVTSGGQRTGIQLKNLGISGGGFGGTNTGSGGIDFVNVNGVTVDHVFFDQMGASAILSTTGQGVILYNNFAQNCLTSHPGIDTGCFDLSTNDNRADYNFVTTSAGSGTGSIGNGHSYAWRINGANGFYSHNMGELSQHGWLVTSIFNTMIGNRCLQNQGNCLNVQNVDNIFDDWKAECSSQTATGTFSAVAVSSARNQFTNFLIEDTANCPAVHTKNGFDDSNSNGAGEDVGNKYSNNHFGINPTGVLYNMTGTSPYRIQQATRNETQTTATGGITFQCGLNGDTQLFNTALSGTVTVTLSTTGAWNGCKFRVIRGASASGASNLSVGGLTGLSGPSQAADVEFMGGAWTLVSTAVLPNNPGLIPLANQANIFTAAQQFSGFTNGTGIQLFNTTTTCTTGATAGAICTTAAITLPVAYADTNYRLSCTGQGPTNVPIVETYAKTNTTFTITIAALTAAAATFTSYDCSAKHN